jgi:nucleotide-binding universal stress UspA family protein
MCAENGGNCRARRLPNRVLEARAVIAINRILCAVDFSSQSHRALEYAGAMGAYYDARVTALHVFSAAPVVTSVPFGLDAMQVVGVQDVNREAVEAAAQRFVAQVHGTPPVDVRVTDGLKVADEVVVQADLLDADVIVVGSHGRSGFERLLLGSTADRILRKARRPVLVVPAHAGEGHGPLVMPFKRIVCPIDFADSSLKALEYALRLAEEADAQLTLLHAIELPPELHEFLPMGTDVATMRSAAERARHARLEALVPQDARTYCTIATRVTEGKVYRQILDGAAETAADLIVMGVHGRGAVDVAVFGSNTQAVVRTAVCPVLTVRT